MDKINKLLKQVSGILVQAKTQQEEKRKRGECFNIFEILGVQSSEVRLHSAFIAELLNPKGNHGLGDKFLKAFIEDVISKQTSFKIDPLTTVVNVEFPIGTISEDYTEGGRIDLLLQDGNKQTIIIENKIYAKDQRCQLLRYNNYASQSEQLSSEQYIIFYLTLEGEQASEYSLGNSCFDYFCISYREDILAWLNHCLELSTRQPLVRETIQQYINNIKTILSIMDNKISEEFIDILTSTENVETTISIIEKSWDIQNRIRKNFVIQVQDACEKLGYCCEFDEGIVNCDYNSWIRIFEKPYKNVIFRIGVESPTKQDGFRMDVIVLNTHRVEKELGVSIWPDANEPTGKNPVGWTYLWSESGIRNSGNWWNWYDLNTLKDMTNGKMFAFVLKILDNIKEQEAFKRISESLEVEEN